MHPHQCDNWAILVGARVEIRLHRQHVRDGVVEAAAIDSSSLWLAVEGGDGPTMYTAEDGYEAWVEPETLPDNICVQVVCHHGCRGHDTGKGQL